MTLFFHDVSNHNGDYHPTGPTIAKATEGTDFTDAWYATNKARTLAGGWPFLAYHYLHHGNILEQVQNAEAVVGAGQPLMLDVEIVIINKVRQPDPTLTDVLDFMAMWPGMVSLVYLPHWFWQGVWGSPSLAPIANYDAGLISSNYTTYSDTGPGWAPYGGMAPSIWQYTSTPLDTNAYKGTEDQLRVLFNEGVVVTQPYTEAQMRAFPWQYAGAGLADNDATPAGNVSTLHAFNELLLTVRANAATLAEIKATLAALTLGAPQSLTVNLTGTADLTGTATPAP